MKSFAQRIGLWHFGSGGGFLLLLGVLSVVCVDQLANGAVTKAWVRRYSNVVSNSQDTAVAVLRDSAGNIIVAGHTYEGVEPTLLLLKYSGANGSLLWKALYEGVDLISAAAVDAHGNVAVAGYTYNGEDYDYFMARYSGEGVLLWARRYDGPSDDKALAVAFDASGNVVVTGGSSQHDYRNDDDGYTAYDYYTAKYAAADGALLWERRYNGPGDRRDLAQAMVIDASDNVVVTGTSFGEGGMGYYTAKYAGADGALLWDKRYDGGVDDRAQAVALDSAGNVVVAGFSYSSEGGHDAHTIKYAAADGAFLWEQRYNGPANREDAVQAVAVDGSGNVIVTGYSADSLYYQKAYTAKYAGADGALLWETLYNPTNSSAFGQALAVDASGDVVMAGYSVSNYWDHYSAKYAGTNGALLWERRRDGPRFGDVKAAVVLDASGNPVLTSTTGGGYDSDVYTAKYAATDGAVLWGQRYTGLTRDQGIGECVAVDAGGNVVVTGSSEGNDSGFDFYTAKYSPHGALLWERRYDGPRHGDDYVRAMALDAEGNPVVSGNSQAGNPYTSDFYTVKYSGTDGAILWEHPYDGPENSLDRPSALAIDGDGNVVVAGYSHNFVGHALFYAAKYAGATGALMWEQRHTATNGHGGPVGMAVDTNGNVVVTGTIWTGPLARADVYTARFAATNGALLWHRQYNGPQNDYDRAVAIAVDHQGNTVVLGLSELSHSYKAKYAAADGALLWERRDNVQSTALAVDAHGNAIVTGGSYADDSTHVHTLKYASANGAVLWERRHDGPSNTTSLAEAVAVDENGNVVVAGFKSNERNNDYFAAKYAATDGAILWEQIYDGETGGEDRVENRCGLALGPNGMVAITGIADGYYGGYEPQLGYGITTVVYREGFEPISIALVSAGVRLRFTGDPGRRYAIQRAPAITGPWDTIATPEAASNGQVEHLDMSSLPGSAFYRSTTP